MTSLGKILASYTYDLLFFSNDVQTTVIAVAVTGSLCCSVIYAIVHLVAKLHFLLIEDEKDSRGMFDQEDLTLTHIKNQIQKISIRKSIKSQPNKRKHTCRRCESESNEDNVRLVGHCHVCCLDEYCSVHKILNNTSVPGPQHIDLSSSKIENVPERLGFIGSQLKLLDLSYNSIQTLPDDIGLLTGLQELYIRNNCLKTIPISIGILTCLSDLDLTNNHITDIPDSLWSLTGLQELCLDKNDLTYLSPKIGLLKNLHTLSVGSNKLEDIPSSIGNLLYLEVFSIPDNPLTVLPDTICQLINLEELIIGGCKLTSLPRDIGSCKSLQRLELESNRLEELPYSIGQLDLEYLYIENNNITVLPSSMEHLIHSISIFCFDNNPLLTSEQVQQFLACSNVCPDIDTVKPLPLLDITARYLYETNQKYTTLLPNSLQVMLKDSVKCYICQRPAFRQRIYDVKMMIENIGFTKPRASFLLIYCSKYCQNKQSNNS